jgi:hypothetical protein
MSQEQDKSKPTVLSAEQARQGTTTGHVRVVLAASLALAALAGIGFLVYYNA